MTDAIVLALALSMDASAVAAARAVSGRRGDAVRMATAFGLFQAGMAAIGWLVGVSATRWIASWDHWLAFGLLAAIGTKMIVEALRSSPESAASDRAGLSLRVLLLLAIATSIDALAAGVTLPILDVPELLAVALIGAVTFVMTLVGAAGASWLGARGGRALDAVGGIALIAIGVKTLVDHLGH